MNKILRRIEFGDPVLRQRAKRLTNYEILSSPIQNLISEMRYTLENKKYGVGLAAPQVGKSLALSVIYIRPTKTRPNLPKSKWADLVIINPKITENFGTKKQMWEGCISLNEVFAQVPRYKKIRLEYFDQKAVKHTKTFEGLAAHVIQHEVDHLNGVFFVEKVADPSTFMTGREYRKRIVPTISDSEIE